MVILMALEPRCLSKLLGGHTPTMGSGMDLTPGGMGTATERWQERGTGAGSGAVGYGNGWRS